MTLPSYVLPGLRSGTQWPTDKTGVTITYTFWTSVPSYYAFGADEHHGFKAFSDTMQTAVQETLGLISSFANITFQQVAQTPDSGGQIGFGQANPDPSAEAYTYYPDGTLVGGDVWANTDYFSPSSDPDATHVVKTDYDYLTIIHEIGHALGLKHSFERPALPRSEDTDQFTVMSYTHSHFYGDIYPESFMPYDIAALQALYGANKTYHTGDDSYALVADHVYTIWDAGGTDTLDGSSLSINLALDLREGGYSSVGAAISHNIAIAYGTTIENARGGAGNDVITGNEGANHLEGGGGADTLIGAGGNDLLDGGTGADAMTGGTGNDTYVVDNPGDTVSESSSGGTDLVQSSVSYILSANVENLLLTGASAINGTGNMLANVITGNGAANLLDGGKGIDVMIGGDGNDIYIVDNTKDVVSEGAFAGTDLIRSGVTYALPVNVENLVLIGTSSISGTGNDAANTLTGNSAVNKLVGGGGNDTLDGGGGADTLTGGSGADTFVFTAINAFHGIDKVTDFSTSGGDALDISNILAGYDPKTEVLTDWAQITDSGHNSILSVDLDGAGTGYFMAQIAMLLGVTGLTDEAALVASNDLLV